MDPSESDPEWSDENENSESDPEWSDENENSETENHGEISELKELCVLPILQYFDRFSAAFKMDNSKVPKKHWEFFARRYSEKIFEKLKEAQQLKREHLDLLINRHTKKLDIVGIDKEIVPYLIQSLKKDGVNIQSFKGSCEDLHEDMCMSLMSALSKVEEIDYVHDEDFSDNEAKTLKERIFRFAKISPGKQFAQVPQICKAIGQNCNFLKNLTFEYYYNLKTRKYNNGIAFILKNCLRLETLQYKDSVGALYELHKNDLPFLKNLKKRPLKTNAKYMLKNLSSDNRYYPLFDALSICAATCRCVSKLHIDYLDSNEELEMISNLNHLQDITFETMGIISSSCLGKFFSIKGSKLTDLEMPYKSGLPIEILIESCPKLQSLTLSYVLHSEPNYTFEHSYKGNLPDLKSVEFSFTDFIIPEADAALKAILSACRTIEKLSLSGSSGVTDKFLRSLELSGIRFLDVSSTDVTADSLTDLLLNGSLKTLQIEYCEKIKYDDYFALTQCVSQNSKNIDIKYRSVRSGWKNFVGCCMAYIP